MELTKVTNRVWYYPYEKERDRPMGVKRLRNNSTHALTLNNSFHTYHLLLNDCIILLHCFCQKLDRHRKTSDERIFFSEIYQVDFAVFEFLEDLLLLLRLCIYSCSITEPYDFL